MLISTRFKFVYLANRKTGSTSIERAFGTFADFKSISGPKNKHITYRQFAEMFPQFVVGYD